MRTKIFVLAGQLALLTAGTVSAHHSFLAEFDPDQPRMENVSLAARFRHYVNLDKTESRLRSLLQEFPFAPMREAFADRLQSV